MSKKPILKSISIVFIIGLGIFFSSCAHFRTTVIDPQLIRSNCNQHNAYFYRLDELPQPIHELTIPTLLSNEISETSLNIANAIEVLDLLKEFTELKRRYSTTGNLEDKISMLEIKQDIIGKINHSSLEVSAVSSELDCEDERIGQIANYLAGKEQNTESNLTIGAIIAGASGAIATGILIGKDKASDYIGLGTGIVEASLGLMMLFNKRKTELYYDRNALKEIWEGNKTSPSFPPSVWYYLNYHNPNDKDHPPIRTQIIEKWMSFGQISDDNPKEKQELVELYFGKGGEYTAEQLQNRADMYDQLKSHINLMKQDLQVLSIELSSFLSIEDVRGSKT